MFATTIGPIVFPDVGVDVLRPETALLALIAGLLLGLFVLGPIIGPNTLLPPSRIGLIVLGASSIAGLVFYLGQAIIDLGHAELHFFAGYALWLIYSVFMAIGTTITLRTFAERRRRRMQEIAAQEVRRDLGE